MTVEELITELAKLPGDMKVHVSTDCHGCWGAVTHVDTSPVDVNPLGEQCGPTAWING